MDVVLDTSAAIAVMLNESHKPELVEKTRDAELLAPMSLPVEVGNALTAMFKRRRISLDQATRAFDAYGMIPVQLVNIDMKAALRLAHDLGIYAYDSYMLDCALRHRCPLLTLDGALKAAANRAGVEILEVMP